MQFALMIYHTPEEFDMRKDYSHPHIGAWRNCAGQRRHHEYFASSRQPFPIPSAGQTVGSMPMRSLTADRILCWQPR